MWSLDARSRTLETGQTRHIPGGRTNIRFASDRYVETVRRSVEEGPTELILDTYHFGKGPHTTFTWTSMLPRVARE